MPTVYPQNRRTDGYKLVPVACAVVWTPSLTAAFQDGKYALSNEDKVSLIQRKCGCGGGVGERFSGLYLQNFKFGFF